MGAAAIGGAEGVFSDGSEGITNGRAAEMKGSRESHKEKGRYWPKTDVSKGNLRSDKIFDHPNKNDRRVLCLPADNEGALAVPPGATGGKLRGGRPGMEKPAGLKPGKPPAGPEAREDKWCHQR